jgi:hypothetical protein
MKNKILRIILNDPQRYSSLAFFTRRLNKVFLSALKYSNWLLLDIEIELTSWLIVEIFSNEYRLSWSWIDSSGKS